MDTTPRISDPGNEAASFCATLVDEWVLAGVQHAVLAPGSRSTPLAVALAARSDLRVHVFHDERSAAFAAMGIGVFSGVPAVLLCTSGTAAAHFHGAVVEAHQSDVPMIVCTADRPPELRDVGAPQTIDQTHLFGSAVRWFHDPGVPAAEASHTWRSLASRAWAAAVGARPGPVHLNLPFREPLLGSAFVSPARPSGAWARDIAVHSVDASALREAEARLSGRKGVIVAGQGSTREVLELAEALGWPVFADARSALRLEHPHVVIGFDPLLRCGEFVSRRTPDVVLRVGQPPASKVLSQWVSSLGAEVVQLTNSAAVIDPDHVVALTLRGDVASMCSNLAGTIDSRGAAGTAWCSEWAEAGRITQEAIEAWIGSRMSEPGVARIVTSVLHEGENLVVSSSMPIRDVEWFGGPTPGVSVFSNRGANGIDGVVSTAVGIAVASGAPTTLLIGDVACVHDSNGLWGLAARKVDLRIVVVNNDGGSIFSFLPQGQQLDTATFELLFGTPHGVSFASLAAAHGLDHVEVDSRDALVAALSRRGPLLIEARFVRAGNVSDHEELNRAVIDAVSARFGG